MDKFRKFAKECKKGTDEVIPEAKRRIEKYLEKAEGPITLLFDPYAQMRDKNGLYIKIFDGRRYNKSLLENLENLEEWLDEKGINYREDISIEDFRVECDDSLTEIDKKEKCNLGRFLKKVEEPVSLSFKEYTKRELCYDSSEAVMAGWDPKPCQRTYSYVEVRDATGFGIKVFHNDFGWQKPKSKIEYVEKWLDEKGITYEEDYSIEKVMEEERLGRKRKE